ncbi:MAG TPA: AAA family ATPase, partial [Acidimicrobiia bacterium]
SASGGTEVKNLGDGLMVMFTSPSRALTCAEAMLQAIDHHNRSALEPLDVRVGISAGEAVEEDGDYFGEPVVEAARLCAMARGGQILAADLVRRLVGRHATQTFVDFGPLELKGLPEPVSTVEVVWEPLIVEGPVPLPRRLIAAAADARFGFVGRARELETLHDVRKSAHASRRGQVIFVAGEPGIGKTALLAQVARVAHSQGALVLFGHADEDLGVAYQPWIEAFRTLVRDGDADLVLELPEAQRAVLARLVPEVGDSAARIADPGTERMLLLEAATELLVAASKRSSVFVVLDDAHWADTATVTLLRHVIVSGATMNLTIACTYRDTDVARGDPLTALLADLHRQPNVQRVQLAGLDDDELVELVTAAAGHELAGDGHGLAQALHRETDGNPFFTAELLRHLGETAGIVQDADGRWSVAEDLAHLGLPSSVREVVGRRVERLGTEAARVLCLASVLGREFDVGLLATLAELDEDALISLLDAAVIAAVLVEGGAADRYRFAHALMQHSLYDELSPARRQRAHRHVAESLERGAAVPDAAALAELAHHWLAAARSVDVDKAIHYVRRAGDAARDALAPDDAIRWYEQALGLVADQRRPDERARAQLLAELGAAQRQTGHPEARGTLLRAAALAEGLDDTDVLVRSALGFLVANVMVGDEDLKRIAAAALERVGSGPTAVRARLLSTFARAHDATLEWQARRELSLQALDTARRCDDDATLVDVITQTHMSLATPDRLPETIENLEHAVGLADQLEDLHLQFTTRHYFLTVCYQACDVARAETTVDELEAIKDRSGLPQHRYDTQNTLVGRILLAGRVDDAENANERALEMGTAASAPDAFSSFSAILSNIRRHQGRLDEIVDFFLDIVRDNPSIGALRPAVAAMLGELGRLDEADERLAVESARDFDLPYDMTWLMGMARFLDAAASTGDRSAARTLVGRVAPYASQIITPAGSLILGATAR